MSGSTKILVIPLKKLIITICVIAALVIIAAIYILSFKKPETRPASASITPSEYSGGLPAPASDIHYTPGVYTSSLMIGGNPADIQVTVDSNNINSIELINLSDSVQTMYPMLTTSFNEIKNAVIENGTTTNITYDSANKYTANLLLSAIQNALNKAVQ